MRMIRFSLTMVLSALAFTLLYLTATSVYKLQPAELNIVNNRTLPDPTVPFSKPNLYEAKCGGEFKSHDEPSWYDLFRDFEVNQRNLMTRTGYNNVLVWNCDGHPPPGLADHVRGFTTAFLLALLMDRAFLIKYNDLSTLRLALLFNFYHPEFKWEIGSDRPIDKKIWHTSDYHSNIYYDPKVYDIPSYLSVGICILAPVQNKILANPFFKSRKTQLGLDRILQGNIPGCLMNYFMKPTALLQSALSNYRTARANKTVIGVQFRSGKGDFADGRDFGTNANWFYECANSLVHQILAKGHTNDTIMFYITSDSLDFKQRFKNHFKQYRTYTQELKAEHFQSVHSPDALMRIVTEFYELSASDHLIISHSGFGQVPTMLGLNNAFEPSLNCIIGNEHRDFSEWRHFV